jgi:hypothetical protein
MRFVDREQRDRRAAQQAAKPFRTGPLGRDVEQVEFARAEAVLRFLPVGIDRGEASGANAERLRSAQLVVHQRDQRRDDDAAAIERHGGKLIAERLACARGHDRQRVLPREHARHHLLLHPAKGGKAEGLVQHVERIAGHAPALMSL